MCLEKGIHPFSVKGRMKKDLPTASQQGKGRFRLGTEVPTLC